MTTFEILPFIGGLVASFMILANRRKEEKVTQELSLAPRPTAAESTPWMKQEAIPAAEWPSLPVQLLAALWYADEIPSEKMPDLACALLERGLDGNLLRRLAGELRPTQADLEPYIHRMFQELGARAPLDHVEALDQIGFHLAQRIAAGELEPFDGAERIAYLFDWSRLAKTRVAPLIAMADDIEFKINHEKESEQREEILSFCKALVESTGGEE